MDLLKEASATLLSPCAFRHPDSQACPETCKLLCGHRHHLKPG